uniref:Myosin tail domain-containing protein n=1 Tax=Parascaris equorum TaxID=6256 RepID=A0A914RNG0_PAREQ
QIEDAESQVAAVSRTRQQLTSQLEDLRRQLEQETRERQSLAAQTANFQMECQQLRDTLEEEQDAKTELQRLVSKANAEAQQWRARYEGEGMTRAEELEEANCASRTENFARISEFAFDEKEQCGVGYLIGQSSANSMANSLDKKQKGFDKIIEEWKRKCDSLVQELEASQRDTRNAATEAFRLRGNLDEAAEQVEAVRRENKVLAQELKDLTDQLGEGGRNVHELQKSRRRLEMEKEELQQALDDAEAALEAEESKVLRAQVEISQIRAEIDKRIAEKEEEFENTRKNHQRAIESMQVGTYVEYLLKARAQIEEEQRQRDEMREQINVAERRSQLLQSEKEDLAVAFEQVHSSNKFSL